MVAGLCFLPSAFGLRLSAQGTAFTYQGRLNDGAAPASGSYDLQFAVYDAASGGSKQAPFMTNSATAVSNGLFTVTLDFGNIFSGAARWLDIGVRTNGGGTFTLLAPRQALTPTPYAIFAGGASNLVGAVSSANLAGTYAQAVTLNNPGNVFAGDGTGVTNVNAAQLNGLAAGNFWQLGGNTVSAGQFLGSTNEQAVEIKVNAVRALRLEPHATSPNVIGGFSGNFVGEGFFGSTIGGGGSLGANNTLLASYATIAGGYFNDIGKNSDASVIGGGRDNNIASDLPYATIAGGISNTIGTASENSAMGGGYNNTIAAKSSSATIAGGSANAIGTNSPFSAMGGGFDNRIAANSWAATIAGGNFNGIGVDGHYSAIGGGQHNNIASNSALATIAGGWENDIGVEADYSAIGGGRHNTIASNAAYATIAGGTFNDIGTNSYFSAMGGGEKNTIGAGSPHATIAGGNFNDIGVDSHHSAIGGGQQNTIAVKSVYATIPGGWENTATSHAFAAGRRAKANHQGAFVWGDSTAADITSTSANSVTMRAAGGYRLFSNAATNAGVSLAAGGTAWAVISDRNVKKDFAPVDGIDILKKLAAIPITRWHYKWEQSDTTPHIGPMAQDFKAAFYPNRDDKSITTQEADGVALAAIQGLNQKLEEQKAENIGLKQRLEVLEKKLSALAEKH